MKLRTIFGALSAVVLAACSLGTPRPGPSLQKLFTDEHADFLRIERGFLVSQLRDMLTARQSA